MFFYSMQCQLILRGREINIKGEYFRELKMLEFVISLNFCLVKIKFSKAETKLL